MKVINVYDIKISDDFAKTKPKIKKIKNAMYYIDKHKTIDKPIVLNNGVLVDRYSRYLASINKKIYEVPFVELQDMIYIVGKFNNCQKEYVWKNDKNIDVEIGDKILVKSSNRNNDENIRVCVTVVDKFQSDSLELYNKHKSVIKKISNN